MSSTGQALGYVVGAVVGYFTGGTSYILMGSALGGAIGGAIDPPKGPKLSGPRLADLSQQGASYGIPIPRIYGSVATFGNIFWIENNALKETSHTEGGGGKGGGGGPETTTYSYSATFAIGLCEGPILGVRRIWVGGNLIYDAGAGDFATVLASNKAATGFRIYLGDESQTPDPRMQAALGAANTPAYRGLAYIVFDDFALEKYGNSLLGAQFKVEVIGATSVGDGYNVFALTRSNGPFIDASQYPSPTYPYGSVVADFTGDLSGRPWSLSGWGKATGGFVGGVLEIEEYQATYPFSNMILTTDADTAFALPGDFTLWCSHNGRNHNIHSSGAGVALVTCSSSGYVNTTGEWALEIRSSGSGRKLYFSIKTPGGVQIVEYVMPGYDPGADYEYKVVRRAGLIGLYIDGTHVATQLFAADTTPLSGTEPIAIGGWYGNHALPNDYATGAYWNVALMRGASVSDAPVPLAGIVESECLKSNVLESADLDTSSLTDMVRGYRVTQAAALRSALEPLQGAFPFDVVQSGYLIRFVRRGIGASVASITEVELGSVSGSGKNKEGRLSKSREMDTQLPRRVSINHLDYDREYDSGEQYAERLNTNSVNEQRIEMAIVFTAAEAARTAEVLLYMYWLERYNFEFKLPPSYRWLEPADIITVNAGGAVHELRLSGIEYGADGILNCTARLNDSSTYSSVASGVAGPVTNGQIELPSATAYELLDIPLLKDAYNTPGFPVAMSGYAAGWPGASLFRSVDGGQTFAAINGFIIPAVLGHAITVPLAPSTTLLIDKSSRFQVRIYEGTLSSVSEAQMLNGSNIFALGVHGRWEIIAAQTCVLQADGSYLLSDLLRGRFGTEWAMGLHAVGDRIVLLNEATLQFVLSSLNMIGQSALYRGVTRGAALDTETNRSYAYTGVNIECLSPVYLCANRNPWSNDWTITWQRRTRVGGEWRDNVDATLGEASELYDVEIYSDNTYGTLKRTFSGLTSAVASYTSAQQISDFGTVQNVLYVKVYQVSGVVGRGYPAISSLVRTVDPYTLVVLGLHMDGTSGSTTFADVKGKTVTASGNAQISTAASKFGGASAYFDGTGDYLSIPNAQCATDMAYGTNDFTIEMWIRPETPNFSSAFICGFGHASIFSTGITVQITNTGRIGVGLNVDAMTYQTSGHASLIDGNFHHVAICRFGNTVTTYIDGIARGSTTFTGSLGATAQNYLIGADTWYSSNNYKGYIDDLRITNGLCRYTVNFTPENVPFGAN